MRYLDGAPLRLPRFLLPCPHCGHRMAITVIEPAPPLGYGTASSDLEDITHGCVQCGTTLTRTMRSTSSAACFRQTLNRWAAVFDGSVTFGSVIRQRS